MHRKRRKETRKEIEEGKKKEEEEGECRARTNFSDMQNLMHSFCNGAFLARQDYI